MSYSVRVTVQVVDEEGHVVNVKGYRKQGRVAFSPCETWHNVSDHDKPEDALKALNHVYEINKQIGMLVK